MLRQRFPAHPLIFHQHRQHNELQHWVLDGCLHYCLQRRHLNITHPRLLYVTHSMTFHGAQRGTCPLWMLSHLFLAILLTILQEIGSIIHLLCQVEGWHPPRRGHRALHVQQGGRARQYNQVRGGRVPSPQLCHYKLLQYFIPGARSSDDERIEQRLQELSIFAGGGFE